MIVDILLTILAIIGGLAFALLLPPPKIEKTDPGIFFCPDLRSHGFEECEIRRRAEKAGFGYYSETTIDGQIPGEQP